MLLVCLAINIHAAYKLENNPTRFRMWNQFTWGVLMPIVCIFGDPFVFGYFEQGQVIYIHDYGLACYAIVTIQVLTLLLSWFLPKPSPILDSAVAGLLAFGGIFALLVALLMSPLTVIGTLLLGMGLPGFTPWLTGLVYINSSRMHFARASKAGGDRKWPWILGATATMTLLGLCTYLLAVNWGLGTTPAPVPELFL